LLLSRVTTFYFFRSERAPFNAYINRLINNTTMYNGIPNAYLSCELLGFGDVYTNGTYSHVSRELAFGIWKILK